MDTIEIDGHQVPVTDLAAWWAKKQVVENESRQTKEALAAANQQVAQAAKAQEAIERVRTDPEFAKQFADTLATVHAESAFFRGQTAPQAPQGATDPQDPNVTPPVDPPVTTPPVTQIPHPDPALAQQVERLTREIAEMRSTSFVDAKLAEIKNRYPSLDPEKVLSDALEAKFPIEHLEAFAAQQEADRLSGVLAEREKGGSLLHELLSPHGEDMDEQLHALGSSLSAAQLTGDAGVDHAALTPEEHVMKAMASVGLGVDNGPT